MEGLGPQMKYKQLEVNSGWSWLVVLPYLLMSLHRGGIIPYWSWSLDRKMEIHAVNPLLFSWIDYSWKPDCKVDCHPCLNLQGYATIKRKIWRKLSGDLQLEKHVVQLPSRVRPFATPWTAALQAFLSFTISWSLLKLMSIESVMLSNRLILCRPLLLLPSVFPSIRVFPNESALRIRWPKYWSFGFSISPSDAYSELISFRLNWFDFLAVSRVFSNTTVRKHQFFSA